MLDGSIGGMKLMYNGDSRSFDMAFDDEGLSCSGLIQADDDDSDTSTRMTRNTIDLLKVIN